jgi:hypothetical protein
MDYRSRAGIQTCGNIRVTQDGGLGKDRSIYQRLPHPLNQLLKEIPVVDGVEVSLLWEFLLKILQIHLMGQFNAPEIYEIIYAYCRGEILTLVTQAICVKEDFEVFHERILRQCVPPRQLAKLRAERYKRVQAIAEPLTIYIQSIKDAAAVLRIAETEEEMVAKIVDGFSPMQRARFVFQKTSLSFAELEKLTIVDKNAAYADTIRREQNPTFQVGRVQAHYNHRQGQQDNSPTEQTDRLNKRIVCFFCNKQSHLQRHCTSVRPSLEGREHRIVSLCGRIFEICLAHPC